MFKWLRNLFMPTPEKKINTATVITNNHLSPAIMQQLKIPRKFEIFVEEFDETKEPGQWRPVRIDTALGGQGSNPVITVSSQNDLIEKQNFYKSVGQRFKIVREIDPPTNDDLYQLAVEQGLIKDTNSSGSSANLDEKSPCQEVGAVITESNTLEAGSHQQMEKTVQHPISSSKCIKPKIITIGDMQIKYDGEKVYQKQWCKLTPTEEQNFRVVNDSNNKIISMTGKHIEAKKWVLVEEQPDDDFETETIFQ